MEIQSDFLDGKSIFGNRTKTRPEVKSCGFCLTVEADERGDLVLKRTTDLGKTFTTIHEDIYSFGYIGAFLFFSVMEDSVRWRKIRCGASILLCTEHQQTGVSLCPPSPHRDLLGSCTSRPTRERASAGRCCRLLPPSR